MTLRRARQALRLPRTTVKNDSSQRRRVHAVAEESRLFRASALHGVQVHGTVKGWTLPKAGLKALLQAYLGALGMPQAGLSLQLVDDAGSQALNRSFRSLDAPTDILSFPAEGKAPPGFDAYLGDLVLDLPYAWRKRGRFHPRFEGEAAFLLLHGLLHLTGLHHDNPAQERALWAVQERHAPVAAPHLARLRSLRPKAVK